ncbi:MAG: hypothetical protein ABSH26_04600 [Opitutaceae bacterium]
MKTFSLMSPQMIDPVWLREVQCAQHEARVHHCGVTLNGVHLRFLVSHEDCPDDGTAMVVWLGRNFCCATKADFACEASGIPGAPLEAEVAAHN